MVSPDSESSVSPHNPSLAVGKIIGTTFAFYLKNFLIFFPVPCFVHFVDQSFFYFLGRRMSESGLSDRIEIYSGMIFFELLIICAIKTILFTLMTLAAFDLNFGNKVSLAEYFRTAIVHFFPLYMLYLGYMIFTSLGMLLLIVPGLYLMAMLSVYLPATLAEQLTSGSLNRSADLTAHHRWSIVVALTLFIGTIFAVYGLMSTMLGVGMDNFFVPDNSAEWWQFAMIYSIADAFGEGLFAVGAVILYFRLMEIKGSGINNSSISADFD